MKDSLFVKMVLIATVILNILLINYAVSNTELNIREYPPQKGNILNNIKIDSLLKIAKKKQPIDNNETN